MRMALSEVLRLLEAPPLGADQQVTGWSTDSRSLAPGDLFFALSGPNHDGHDYVVDAVRAGAVAAVVERPAGGVREIIVPSVLGALQALAAAARRLFQGRVIGITGSAGKTTTKEVIAHFLAAAFRVARSAGNLNNHIGLPLSILRAPQDAGVVVLEMGMNHAGEIRRLAEIARHDVAVVTNVGAAHIENFASIEGIALAKRELVETLPPEGVAILNADDFRVAQFASIAPGLVLTFGLAEGASIRATDVQLMDAGVRFRLNGRCEVSSPLIGRHGVSNLLAGFAAGSLLGIPEQDLVVRAASVPAPRMRGERMDVRGVTVIDDSYNANPEAMAVMLETLAGASGHRKLAVLGEMLELGRWSAELHREVGRKAASSGLAVLAGVKGMAREMVDEARRCGMSPDQARFFERPEDAGAFLASVARAGDVVLFKGSRGTRVELALEAFLHAG